MANQAGIVLAAGFSSRMGCLKAALPFAGRTVLERQIDALRMAGCEQVVVVSGYEEQAVALLAEKSEATVRHNIHYTQGMFTSVQTGVSALPDDADGFVILPVDCVRVSPRVIHQVIQAGMKTGAQAVMPCFRGEAGHPPWFPALWKDKIMNSEGPLDELIRFEAKEGLVRYEETDTPAILWDMDTPQDYDYMLAYESHLPFLVWEELLEEQELPERTRAHGRAVAQLAWEWASAINRRQAGNIDERLTYTGGLLHDMAKKHPNHEREGGRILRWHGYDRLAEIVEEHMGLLPGWDGETITEKELVYAADKMVRETTRVSVRERYRPAKEAYGHDPQILAKIEDGERKALEVVDKIKALMERR